MAHVTPPKLHYEMLHLLLFLCLLPTEVELKEEASRRLHHHHFNFNLRIDNG
jgi:hypothetical protein